MSANFGLLHLHWRALARQRSHTGCDTLALAYCCTVAAPNWTKNHSRKSLVLAM